MKQIANILNSVFEKETKLENEETTLLHKQVQKSLPGSFAVLGSWIFPLYACK